MKLRCLLSLLTAFCAFAAVAADNTGSNPILATNAPTSLTSTKGTNDVIELPVIGKNYTNLIGMELVPVPGGYWAGKYEVTQKEYQKIMMSNPSAFVNDKNPVDSVSWNDAMQFCTALTTEELNKGALTNAYHYTLPTEAEWLALVGDASVDNAVTSLNGAVRQSSSMAGSEPANSLGLYDVYGNVMEFCLSEDAPDYRYLKGGSWEDHVDVNFRPEFRWKCAPDDKANTFGLRVLLKAN
jgi:formylglycine-generating enzyme required for sulfatase activity